MFNPNVQNNAKAAMVHCRQQPLGFCIIYPFLLSYRIIHILDFRTTLSNVLFSEDAKIKYVLSNNATLADN